MKDDGADAAAAAKRRAGESAADRVEDGMVVGLGTGSTTAAAIERLGDRVDAGLDIAGIPTSYQSRQLAIDVGIPLTSLDTAAPDIAIDGADQICGPTVIKGGGAAHTREKIVDTAADRFLVVADETKRSDTLDYPLPLAVLPSARTYVAETVEDMGGEPTLRQADRKDGPVVTDNGNLVIDCDFGRIDDPGALASSLSALPGVVEHGLFVELVDELHVGTAEDVTIIDPSNN